MQQSFDVIVVGGGHAGVEAAYAAATLGVRTALVTMSVDAIGRMSCNPAIGGLGKGQMVCEVDALGGLMGRAIDQTGIQFRLLNRSKGPAVRSPRAQADRLCYADWVREALEKTANLTLLEGTVAEIETADAPPQSPSPRRRVTALRLEDGRRFVTRSVVIAAGTFLCALMHCGTEQTPGGRVGEGSAVGLSKTLRALGLRLGRLKTGTPARIHRDSIDYRRLEPQPGDPTPTPFSFLTDRIERNQISCWITYTNEKTHELIRDNLHLAPMYSGQIQSRGPRYCPSIEDKVVRFADKPRHQIFLEPEGYDNERVYCNGISTSLPADLQVQMLHSIAGLENAKVLQPGYAVEYDFVPTDQTSVTLECKGIEGLFLAGQINGTSGYEEAAGQGIVAGTNAALRVREQDPLVLRRDQAYIGVMIDDLVTKPPTEPYRMFTSRAEYRLILRSDNADARLTPLGRGIGLVDDRRWERYTAKQEAISRVASQLASVRYRGAPLAEFLRRPEVTIDHLAFEAVRALAPPSILQQTEIQIKLNGYVQRQNRQVERFQRMEHLPIPDSLDFMSVKELRAESREKLHALQPKTLGQAGRISGISPSDITVLWVHIAGKRGQTKA